MTAEQDQDTERIEAPSPATTNWSERIALWAFVTYLAIAFVVIMSSFDWMWFLGDDWGMIDGRDLFSVEGLLAPQNGHPSAVPVAVMGVLYRIFGLHTYLPYLGVTLALHLTLAGLLRIVMRRAGVGPWMATITAATFVLFGTGWQNMVMAIQISMVSSMVFGISQLILADHDGPFERRDALAIVAGLVAVSASSVGIAMAIIVGVAVLVRRGPKMAAFQTVPLAVAYVAWRLWAATLDTSTSTSLPSDLPSITRWLWTALTGVFVTYAQYTVAAVALVLLLVVGLVLAYQPLSVRELRRTAAAPLALLFGCIVLIAIIASQRAALDGGHLGELARSSRYMAMGVALILPAVGVAANAFVRRWRFSAPFVVLVLVVGVPGNIGALRPDDPIYNEPLMTSQRRFVTAAATSPLVRKVPSHALLDPNEFLTSNLTAGFIAHAEKIGKVPDPEGVTPELRQIVDTRLSLGQSVYAVDEPPHTCTVYDEPIVVEPAVGDRFMFQGAITVQRQDDDGGLTWPTPYRREFAGATLEAQVPDTTYRISSVGGSSTFTWCTVP